MPDDFDTDIDFSAAIAAESSTTSIRNASTPTSNQTPKVQQPKPQALPSRSGPSSILVSAKQKGNPVLAHIKSLPWEWADIPADFVLGNTTCALFLSLRYHRLHPEYVYTRIRNLKGKYNLRVMLTLVDIDNHQEPLKELSKTSLINNLTLILCWSSQEAGRYLELFKSYENASPASIKARESTKPMDRMVDFVTEPRAINKTDALALISNFGSLRNAVNARPEEIALVPGWGEKKVQQWCGNVREPFRVRKAAKAGVGLPRTTSAEDANMSDDPDGTGAPGRLNPVPIGTVRRNESRGTPSAENTGQKRPATSLELWEPGDDDDEEEEALLIAAAEEASRQSQCQPKQVPLHATMKEDNLGEGVAAALEKLRNQT